MAEYTFNSLVEEIAKNKSKLSENRFQKTEKNEIPREVYLNTCETIAQYYEPLGFKYSKSQQQMTLKKGEFSFVVSFQSSRYNIADENVKITVFANTTSSKLKKWEKGSPYEIFNKDPSGYFGGGQIGNLQEKRTWLEWNVAYPETRDEVISNIIENINNLALSYFDEFSDISSIKNTLINNGERHSIDRERFLLYFFTKQELEHSIITFLTKSEVWEQYKKSLELLRKGEKVGGTYWDDLAKIKFQLDLKIENP